MPHHLREGGREGEGEGEGTESRGEEEGCSGADAMQTVDVSHLQGLRSHGAQRHTHRGDILAF